MIVGIASMVTVHATFASSPLPKPEFEKFFEDKALRLEFYQFGDARELSMSLHELVEEPVWPENPRELLTPFSYGKFLIKVLEVKSNQPIYAKGFDTLFAEYATTPPALEGKKRTFQTSPRIPMPKVPVIVILERRMADNSLVEIYRELISPDELRIRREAVRQPAEMTELQITGGPHDRLDLVFVSEGYTVAEKDKFKNDAARMTEHLFSVEPYRSARQRFNVRAVFEPSEESGTDNPRKREFRNTLLSSSFNTLNIDRYLLLEDNHRLHQIAACVPYDTIVVLVNSTTYGGGSICLDFCITTASSPSSPMVFVHELGHGMSYLADEYVGNVSYNDMYPEGIEPVEPNITRELDPNKIKWRSHLTKDVSLPTKPAASNASPSNTSPSRVVGAFEGGGYVSKGMYRPENHCWMGNANSQHGFCVVCEESIRKIIDYYASPTPLP